MGSQNKTLTVVMYHYVRDLPQSRFPRIKGMLLDDFRSQVGTLAEQYEMGRLDTVMAYLAGTYQPKRDLCLLTFDDGLQEHYSEVTPILADLDISGLFFLISGCQEYGRVAPVHMNHFLTAQLSFEPYRDLFIERLGRGIEQFGFELSTVGRIYPWDTPEAGQFKYLFNFVLEPDTRDRIVRELFIEHLGSETSFSRELYLSWDQARSMQNAGMIMGGHSHQHRPLAGLSDDDLSFDLRSCRTLLDARLQEQVWWPFCYPYGKRDSFDARTTATLRNLNFGCAFSTETGTVKPGDDLFSIRRMDCNRVTQRSAAQSR